MGHSTVVSFASGTLRRLLRLLGGLFMLLGAAGLLYMSVTGLDWQAPNLFLYRSLHVLLGAMAICFCLVALDVLASAFGSLDPARRSYRGVRGRTRQVAYVGSGITVLLQSAWASAVLTVRGMWSWQQILFTAATAGLVIAAGVLVVRRRRRT